MATRRLSLCILLSKVRNGWVLEAEGEHEHQREQAKEAQRRAGEQREHRCDRVFYMAEWLAHLLSPLFSGLLEPP
jgi:hypothetical protein